MFKVIRGNKREKPDYARLYINAYAQALQKLIQYPDDEKEYQRDIIKQIVFCSVKYINSSKQDSQDYDTTEERFSLINRINAFIGYLTPNELLQVFPLHKRYDGLKYEMKDYFYSMDAIREHGGDKPIGETILEFLWDYTNLDIELFVVESMCVLSDLRRFDGHLGLMEEFAIDKGMPLSTIRTDSQGRMFLTDGKTGKVQRVYRKKPHYLKIAR